MKRAVLLTLFIILASAYKIRSFNKKSPLVSIIGSSKYNSDVGIPKFDPSKIALQIRYCGGWGYEKFYLSLREELEAKFPGRIEYFPIRDLETTGNFEITILNSEPPKVIHCKNTMSLGKCETREERERLFRLLME